MPVIYKYWHFFFLYLWKHYLHLQIQSPFQPTQVFQQCSGANQAEIWENFTSTIEQVYAPVYRDRWTSTPLKPPDYPDHIHHSMRESEISSTIPTSHHYSFNPLKSNRSFSRSQRIHTRFSESSVSLPDIFSQTDDKFPRYQTVHKCNSLNCLDEREFDSFVNDAQKRFREYNAHDATNFRNDSSDTKVEPNNPKVNISNNSINPLSSMITQEQSSALKQPGGIQKFFGWIFNCCRSDKKWLLTDAEVIKSDFSLLQKW